MKKTHQSGPSACFALRILSFLKNWASAPAHPKAGPRILQPRYTPRKSCKWKNHLFVEEKGFPRGLAFDFHDSFRECGAKWLVPQAIWL